MSNGQGLPANPLDNQIQLQTYNGVISPDVYRRNMEALRAAQETLAQFERQTLGGYNRFITAEQELRNRVEAGRQAE
ncbi:hypothetical protein PHLCEN_2v9499 [Hermanssonia centrifuga]|uniref:Uncharacterized protein n=1 Tax=Hermanssonia centrifuga TaxID=98765 RepID=A0A1U7KFZ4_9APHY|nr:hypothetical protein PHLCEN_2v9499 [Hermanssonia centrifuga]